jgi:predicted nucleic acid-binding protein
MIIHPKASLIVEQCNLWLESLILKDTQIAIPEIADYEIRRELLRAKKIKSINKLDALKLSALYIPITTEMMLKASEFWAVARMKGKPTADKKALDGDVILAAQAFLLTANDRKIIIATTNVKHLSMFVDAREWSDIE